MQSEQLHSRANSERSNSRPNPALWRPKLSHQPQHTLPVLSISSPFPFPLVGTHLAHHQQYPLHAVSAVNAEGIGAGRGTGASTKARLSEHPTAPKRRERAPGSHVSAARQAALRAREGLAAQSDGKPAGRSPLCPLRPGERLGVSATAQAPARALSSCSVCAQSASGGCAAQAGKGVP